MITSTILPSIILLTIITTVILYLNRYEEKLFYNTNDYPYMKDFEINYNQISKEVNMIPINTLNIFRNRDKWTGNNTDEMKELIKELDKESGWIYSWHPNDVNLVNKDWLNYPLYYQGHKFEKNLEKCPTLKNILEKKSDIINLAGLSLMRPRSRLPYHKDMTGPTYGSMAYHLGINVPDGSYLYVKKKKINEQNAKSIIFNSEYLHAAENESFEDRIILYIDFKII